MDDSEKCRASRDTNLALYSEYNKTLRSWLVAFGIGLPAVFVTSKDAKDFLLKAIDIEFIITIFLLGAACQVAVGFLNKFISWAAYHRDDCTMMDLQCHPVYRHIAALENAIGIDFVLDLATLWFFTWAIIVLLNINPGVA